MVQVRALRRHAAPCHAVAFLTLRHWLIASPLSTVQAASTGTARVLGTTSMQSTRKRSRRCGAGAGEGHMAALTVLRYPQIHTWDTAEGGATRSAPPFGGPGASYASVSAFYDYWLGFSSRRSFAWCDEMNVTQVRVGDGTAFAFAMPHVPRSVPGAQPPRATGHGADQQQSACAAAASVLAAVQLTRRALLLRPRSAALRSAHSWRRCGAWLRSCASATRGCGSTSCRRALSKVRALAQRESPTCSPAHLLGARTCRG